MDNSLFFKNNMQKVEDVFEVEGISKFRYPKGHEEEGKIIPWKIKKINTTKVEELTETCTTKKYKKGQKIIEVDQKRLNDLIMAESIVFPDLKDKELLEQYKCTSNVELMRALLNYASDYGKIYQAYAGINDTEITDEEKIEEIKN